MSLEEAVKSELLRMRKTQDGVTVGALARTEALRQVLGGGDPRLAYNGLKHIMIVKSDSLAVVAASYSLGFASDAPSHLGRLDDFGTEYGYDQRQARRHSDKGVVELARHIGSEWTLEASPVLDVHILRADEEVLEVYVRAERLRFIDMREPLIEAVEASGARAVVTCDWREAGDDQFIRAASNFLISLDDATQRALSIRWQGEIWPRFAVSVPPITKADLGIEALGCRLQLVVALRQAV